MPQPLDVLEKTLLIRIVFGSISIFLGGAIYLLWRKPILHMFNWLDIMGFNSLFLLLRDWTSNIYIPPDWLLYSLPTALWTFGGLLLFQAIWRGSNRIKFLWAIIFCCIALGIEFSQRLHLIPGTFDVNDLILSSFAIIAFFTLHLFPIGRRL